MKKIALILTTILPLITFAQTGSSAYRQLGIMNGNRIQTVFTNYGVLAQPSLSTYPRLAWMNKNNGYLGDCSPVIGIELPIKDYTGDGIADTIHTIKITAVDRPGGGKSSISGNSWTVEPLPGYYNTGNSSNYKIAISTDPQTWPASWPDHPEWGGGVWNGLKGANSFTGSMESFFKMDDNSDDQMFQNYGFIANASDTTKKGTGLEIASRLIQFSDADFQDVLFRVYDITNTSTTDYQKVVFGNLTGTYIGIAGDEYNDDVSLFYPKDNIIISSDFYNDVRSSANPNWVGPVGRVGEKLLSSPQQNRIASFTNFIPASNIRMADNEAMWKLLKPGNFSYPQTVTYNTDSLPTATMGMDGDYIYGTDYFSLPAKNTKRIISAIAYGNNDAEVLMRLKKAEVLANCNFSIAAIDSAIAIADYSGHWSFGLTTNITWKASATCTAVEIWYSPDAGRTWTAVERNAPNTGTYSWNTELYKNSPLGMLRLFAKKDGKLFGISDSKLFIVKNGSSNPLLVQLLSPDLPADSVITTDTLACSVYASTFESRAITMHVFYSLDTSAFYPSQVISMPNMDVPQPLVINLGQMPNSKTFTLKLLLTDGVDTVYDVSPIFRKQTAHNLVNPSSVNFANTSPDATIEARIVDKAALTNHKYRVTFIDTAYSGVKRLNVFDVTANEYKLKDYVYTNDTETPTFDGITLYVNDFETYLNISTTRWSIERANNMLPIMTRFKNSAKFITGLTPPSDYCIVIGNNGTYSSDSLPSLPWTGSSGVLAGKSGINFNVYSIFKNKTPEHIKFYYIDHSDTLTNKLSLGDGIYLSNNLGTIVSYKIQFGYSSGETTFTVPAAGDTLWLYTKKGLTIFDTLFIDAPNAVKGNSIAGIKGFQLHQNYPNPFNPTTTITYSLPEQTRVTLSIYNQIGQRIALLYSGEMNAGTHSAVWNASNFASGVYFYELRTDRFTSVRKLMLLK